MSELLGQSEHASTFNATTSHPLNLLSMAGLNIAKSRIRPATCNFVRIVQTCLGRSGGLAPVNLPLFQGTRLGGLVTASRVSGVICSSVREGDHGGGKSGLPRN